VIEEDGYPVISKRVSRYIWDLRRPEGVNDATKNLRRTGMNRAGIFCPSMKLSKKWRFLVGAPFKISDKCCYWLKKKPLSDYAKRTGRKPILGVLLEESSDRERIYKQQGCNAYNSKTPTSWPIAFWTKADVWEYARQQGLEYPCIYDMGYTRCGCVFCGFGAHMEKQPNRFQRLKQTHPKLWKYCMDKLGLRDVMAYIGVPVGALQPRKRIGRR